jgi:endonuclease/exonuclease/phosphatase (EEP) superfamily protein YafD
MTSPPDITPAEEAPAPVVTRRDGGRVGAVVGWALAAGLVGLIAAMWAGGELSAPPAALTVVVIFLPHLFALLAAAAFALWVVAPDRRLPPFLSGGAVLVAAIRWGPTWSADPDPPLGDPLLVMTWNVQRLWGEADGAPSDCVRSAIEAIHPDVLALLEVTAQDVGDLAGQLGMSCRHTPYTGDGPRVGGLAVCTRGEQWHLRGGEGQPYVDRADWSYLFAEIEGPSGLFNMLAVHLVPYRVGERDLRRAWARGGARDVLRIGDRGADVVRTQSDQSAALLARVAKLRDPTVIAGDFNSTRDTALHVALRRTLTDAWERGGQGFGATIRVFGAIPLRVDHVYTSAPFRVLGAEVPPVHCSDHQPVVVRLSLPARGS